MLQNGERPIIHPGGNGTATTAPFPNWECAAASLLPLRRWKNPSVGQSGTHIPLIYLAGEEAKAFIKHLKKQPASPRVPVEFVHCTAQPSCPSSSSGC